MVDVDLNYGWWLVMMVDARALHLCGCACVLEAGINCVLYGGIRLHLPPKANLSSRIHP